MTDYTEFSPEEGATGPDKYTVRVGSASVPTFRIDEIDERLTVHVDPGAPEHLVVPTGEPVTVETPLEVFDGQVSRVQFENGLVVFWIERADGAEPSDSAV